MQIERLPNPWMFRLRTLILSLFSILTTLSAWAQNNRLEGLSQDIQGFIPNYGQLTDNNGDAVPQVLAYLQAGNVTVFLTEKGLTYLSESDLTIGTNGRSTRNWERVDMQLDGAKIKAKLVHFDKSDEMLQQYYVAGQQEAIRVQKYERILIADIYPEIDWELLIGTEGFKYNFIVHPGADIRNIRMHYATPQPIQLNTEGKISVVGTWATLIESAPVSYYADDEQSVASEFVCEATETGGSIFQFGMATYDQTRTLIIDPSLWWCTYYGGLYNEEFTHLTADADGNIIAVGFTESANFPTFDAGTFYQGSKSVNEDVVIVKFSPTGERLWATFYGGNAEDFGYGITTDATGNIFVTGETVSPNFPTQNAGTYFQAGLNGDEDVFILKFNSDGTRQWATFYGGDNKEGGHAIATDPAGNIFVTGYTKSSNFPKLNAGTYYQASMAGVQDAFMLKFSNTGSRLWATYYGGNAFDEGNALVSDSDGEIFMTGTTKSTTLPVYDAGTYYQGTMVGDTDVYVIKFSNTGSRLWATYYGSDDAEYGQSITCDASDNIYVGGYTRSWVLFTHTPTLERYWQFVNAGGTDLFIFEVDNSGNCIWSTFYGGTGNEIMDTRGALSISGCGDLYVSATSFSTDLPLLDAGCSSYYDATNAGEGDIWVSRFHNTGAITWGTLFGFENQDIKSCITTSPLDGSSLFMTGVYHEYDPGEAVPLINPGGTTYYDGSHNGDDECFVAKFVAVPLTLSLSYSNLCYCLDSAIVTPSCGVAPYAYLWADGQTDSIATGLCAGLWDVTVTDADCNVQTTTFTIDCILPLELLSFNGYADGIQRILSWTMAEELTTQYCLLERIFNNTTEIIDTIWLDDASEYSYTDIFSGSGTVYYRLTGFQTGGKFVFEETIAIEEDIAANNLIIQYPEYERAELDLQVAKPDQTIVRIMDISGATVATFNWQLQEGNNQMWFEHPDLPKGYYLIQVAGANTLADVGFYHQ